MHPGAIRRLLRDLRYMLEPRPFEDPRFPLTRLADARRYFDDHGWVVIRNVFTPDEILEFRKGVLKSREQGLCGDLLSNPMLEPAVTNEGLARAVKALLPGKPIYFGDTGWNSASTHRIQMGFHKDNPDKESQDAPDWRTPYTVVTMGIYLQDTSRHSGGLAVRDRSQHTVDVWTGRPIAVPSEPGDIVLWSYTTSHTGYASRFRLFPKAFLPINLQSRLTVKDPSSPAPVFQPPPVFRPAACEDRLALFLGFGIDDKHLRRNIRYLKTRRYWVKRLQASHYSPEAIARLEQNGIGFMDIAAEVRDFDINKVPEPHFPFPVDASDEQGNASGHPKAQRTDNVNVSGSASA